MGDRGGQTLVRGENAKARAAGSGAESRRSRPAPEEPPRLQAPLPAPLLSILLLPYLPLKNSVLTICA